MPRISFICLFFSALSHENLFNLWTSNLLRLSHNITPNNSWWLSKRAKNSMPKFFLFKSFRINIIWDVLSVRKLIITVSHILVNFGKKCHHLLLFSKLKKNTFLFLSTLLLYNSDSWRNGHYHNHHLLRTNISTKSNSFAQNFSYIFLIMKNLLTIIFSGH